MAPLDSTSVLYLLTKGFTRPNTSPYATPILFMPKKDGGFIMCIDYCALNRITIKSCYPIPRADELLNQLRDAKFFSKIDLRGGYHQIRVAIEDCHNGVSHPLRQLRVPGDAFWPHESALDLPNDRERNFQGTLGQMHYHLRRQYTHLQPQQGAALIRS
ncbi:hypothetical protein CLOM_g14453 [Closterium sp. NIES-68]|nr:hypothetical protein CLOM_g14453 [Closterium sp. NIES-68]